MLLALVLLLSSYGVSGQKFKWNMPNEQNVGTYEALLPWEEKNTGATSVSTNPDAVDLNHAVTGSYLIVPDFTSNMAPVKDITVAVWVRIDSLSIPYSWGSFVSFVQDNGSFERGW